MEVRYNLPTAKGETCKFNVTANVKEIKEVDLEDLFGPVQDEEDDRVEKKRPGKNGCKGKNKNKKRCKGKSGKKKKHRLVKSIHLKVCTR